MFQYKIFCTVWYKSLFWYILCIACSLTYISSFKTSSDAENKDKLTNKEDDNVKEESDDEEYYDTSEEDNYDNENASTSFSKDSAEENDMDVPEYDPAKTNPEEEGWAEFEDKYWIIEIGSFLR